MYNVKHGVSVLRRVCIVGIYCWKVIKDVHIDIWFLFNQPICLEIKELLGIGETGFLQAKYGSCRTMGSVKAIKWRPLTDLG